MRYVKEIFTFKKEEIEHYQSNVYSVLSEEGFDAFDITKENIIKKAMELKGDKFDLFIDKLSYQEVIYLCQDDNFYDKLSRRLRNKGHKHEWCPVSRFVIFKKWGLKVQDIKNFVSFTNEVYFIYDNQISRHGEGCSVQAHNDLFKIIESVNTFEEYKLELNKWANKHLTNKEQTKPSAFFLPKELQVI